VGPCFAALGNFVDDIKVLQSKFVFVKFFYVSKCCNKIVQVFGYRGFVFNFCIGLVGKLSCLHYFSCTA
jgi:hypothetical protein